MARCIACDKVILALPLGRRLGNLGIEFQRHIGLPATPARAARRYFARIRNESRRSRSGSDWVTTSEQQRVTTRRQRGRFGHRRLSAILVVSGAAIGRQTMHRPYEVDERREYRTRTCADRQQAVGACERRPVSRSYVRAIPLRCLGRVASPNPHSVSSRANCISYIPSGWTRAGRRSNLCTGRDRTPL